MIFDKSTGYCNGEWHCPFTPDWVDRMKRAVNACKHLTAEQIEGVFHREAIYYRLAPGDFLSQPQDARGIPIAYNEGGRIYANCDIYDYNTIPDVVVTNGHEDWPFTSRFKVLQA